MSSSFPVSNEPSASARGRTGYLVVAAALLLCGFCGLIGAVIFELRRDTLAQAELGANNLLMASLQDVERSIETYDLAIRAAVGRLTDPRFLRLDAEAQQMALFDRAAVARDLGSLLVLNRDGDVVRDLDALPPRRDNFADRSYFRYHRDHPRTDLYISAPFRRRLTGSDHVVALSRRLDGTDGAFAGVVVATMPLAFVRGLFEKAVLGDAGSISLFRDDGVLLARMPHDPDIVGRDLSSSPNVRRFLRGPSGSFSGASAIDGVVRIYHHAHVRGLPLVLSVALGERDVFAAWRARSLLIGSVLLALCASTTALVLLLRREVRRRAASDRSVRRSEAQYRLLTEHTTDAILRTDAGLRCTYASRSIIELLGYDPTVAKGMTCAELVHNEDTDIVLRVAEQVRGRGGGRHATFRARHRGGHFVWVEGSFGHLPEDGSFVLCLRDASHRKLAEDTLAAANAELEVLARTDALTGLANRRRFDEVLSDHWRQAARERRPLAVLLLDVDHFKRFNDRYGHQRGDGCLQLVADAVVSSVRQTMDVVARYGGEEIAVVLPDADRRSAGAMAERARAAVEALGLEHLGNPDTGGVVTVSVGYASTWPGTDLVPGAIGQLLASADRGLYAAKQAGRNRAAPAGDDASILPVHAEEERRLAVVEAYRGLQTLELDRIARLAAEAIGAPIGLVSLVGADRHEILGRHGVDEIVVARLGSFCAHTILGHGPMCVPDATKDQRFTGDGRIAAWSGPRFYAGTSLFCPTTHLAFGTVCVLDPEARTRPTAAQLAALNVLAAKVVMELERKKHGMDVLPGRMGGPPEMIDDHRYAQ